MFESWVGFEKHGELFGVDLVEFRTNWSCFDCIHVISTSVGIDVTESLSRANISDFNFSSDWLIEFRSLLVFEAQTCIDLFG